MGKRGAPGKRGRRDLEPALCFASPLLLLEGLQLWPKLQMSPPGPAKPSPLPRSAQYPPQVFFLPPKAWDSASKGPAGLAAAPLSGGHQARVSRAPAGGVTPKGPCAPGLAATGLLGRGDRFLFNAGPAHRPRRGHAATAASCVTTSGPRSPDTREQATRRASGSPSPPRTHSQSSLGPALHRPTSPPHTR